MNDLATMDSGQVLQAMKPIPMYMYLHLGVQALVVLLGIVFLAIALRRTRTFFCRPFLVMLVMWILAWNAVPDFVWRKPVWQEFLEPSLKGMATAILFAFAGHLYCRHYVPRTAIKGK